MPNYIKVKTGSSSWSTATKAYVKKSTGWVEPIRIWMKFLSGWTRVWPISGPFALTSPFIASTASGSTHLMPTSPIRIGTIYYGRNGTWDANGWTISSYSYQWRKYNLQSSADDTGQTNRSSGTFASPSAPYTPTSADDKKYLSFYIKPNTTDTFEMSEAESGDDDGRLFAITQIPLNTSVSLTATSQVGTVIALSSSWDTSDARQIETSRIKVAWYKNTTASFTGATLIKNNLGSVAGAYSYTPVTADQNNYIIARETAFNSGSDYSDGVLTLANTVGSGTEVGVTAQAISGLVTSALAAPTISSITVSNIGGPVSVSFTGGSGPFYQIFWWGTATAPTGSTTADASGTASPLTDNTGPSSTATQYMYVRSTTTQFESSVGPSSVASAWSAGVSFNMTPAPALTPTFGTNTSTANGFTGSVTNYDSAYNWNTPSNGSFTLTNGTWTWGTASGSTRPFTVTGLSSSQSSTATVTTTRTDYTSGSASTTGTASAAPQYTVTWNANGGTGGGSTTQNAGVAHTAPSATRSGYTLNGYYNTPSGDYTYGPIAAGGSFTPPSTITMYARWTLTPIIPTITMSANSGITQTSGTINWTSTNQASFTSSGTISGSGTTATSVTNNSLSAGTNYTGTVTVTSSTGNTASANYSLTTSVQQYTVTWSPNLSGATVSPASNTVNSGTTVTSPTPTRSGYTFLYWRDGTTVFNYANQINPGGSWTVTYTTTFYAWWSLNPVIPSGGTVSISTNTGNYNVGSVITYSTSGWADTPTSYSLRLYNGTNPVLTSDPLRASTSSASGTYTIVSGDVPNYFKAFATATNSAGTSTEASSTQVGPAAAAFVAPTCVAPSLQFLRTSGSSRLDWYCDYPTPSGDYSSITGMDFQIRTTAGGGTLLASGTRAYPGYGTYPYSAAGTIWAFRMGTANGDISYSSSARYGRSRVIMLGSNGSTYYGTWTGWI